MRRRRNWTKPARRCSWWIRPVPHIRSSRNCRHSPKRSLTPFLAEVALNHDVQMAISTHTTELVDSELVLTSQILVLHPENGEMTGKLLLQSNDPRVRAVISAGLPKSEAIDAVVGRTIPLGCWSRDRLA